MVEAIEYVMANTWMCAASREMVMGGLSGAETCMQARVRLRAKLDPVLGRPFQNPAHLVFPPQRVLDRRDGQKP